MYKGYKLFLLLIISFVFVNSAHAQQKDSISKQDQLNRIKKEKLRDRVKISDAKKNADKKNNATNPPKKRKCCHKRKQSKRKNK